MALGQEWRPSAGDSAELAVFEELRRVQEWLPEFDTLTIMPNSPAYVLGREFVPDIVVIRRGRAGVIEVDGATHYGRWEADRSRDRLLENAGFAYVDRFDAQECEDAGRVNLLVSRFLARLVG